MTRALAAAALAALAAPAYAGQCHLVDVSFIPTDQLQLVVWVEQADGTFVDTIYMTQKTATFGLGNRPGRYDFNSGPVVHDLWPYGRRTGVFPVWAHRQGQTWPLIVFQDGFDDGLSHMVTQSSLELGTAYCRPMVAGGSDASSWDAGTCASPGAVHTDKGIFASDGSTSLYPPRADLITQKYDSPSVALYAQMNPFQAISHATPSGGTCAQVDWPIPTDLPNGNYVMWVEASKTFDFNATYNATAFPAPIVPYGSYGLPYRGQPSIVYAVPFTIGDSQATFSTQSYAGYGDVDGSTGTLHAPDATITTDTPGSGASRLQLIAGTNNRVQVDVLPENDSVPPAAVTDVDPTDVEATSATVQFTAPGDDGDTGSVAGYTIYVRANDAMTPDNFASSTPVMAAVTPGSSSSQCGAGGNFPPAGTTQQVIVPGLLPLTQYWIGIQAFDKCHNTGPVTIAQFTTPDRVGGTVDACFVATAAYGSKMANDVDLLRRFRDQALESSVLGELAVETYYTFSPPVAGVIGQSELLRQGARDVLAPIVERVRRLRF